MTALRGGWQAAAMGMGLLVLAGCTGAGGGPGGQDGGSVSSGSTGGGGASTTTGTGGTSGACVTAADCPGSDGPCGQRTCAAGTCGVDAVPLGTALTAQTAGDCLLVVCDGQGGTSAVPDDSDVLSDGNPCTVDGCTAGQPTHAWTSAGTPCGAGQCDGAGSCVGCLADADCGAATACATPVCAGGTCTTSYAPQGFLAGTQTSGDCQRVVCDGQGGTSVVADDSDVPSDGNPCTVDACTGGQPSHLPALVGTACGPQGLQCNGAGTCVGCVEESDCGASTACAVHACDGATGQCTVSYVPSGQGDPGGQTAGDCKQIVCNGSGGTVSVADDGDDPDDGNPCTVDGCTAGQPTHAPASAGTPCGGGFQCDGAGSCVGCLMDADCGAATACATPVCAGGTCAASYVPSGQGDPGGQVAGDCQRIACDGGGGTVSVPDDGDVPDDGNPCTVDACTGGVPSHAFLPADADCGVGLVCDGAGSCVGCLVDADCGPSTVCAAVHCQAGSCVADDTPAGTGDPGGQVAGDCKQIVCNGTGGTTTVPDDADIQDDGNPCTADVCTGGAPQHLPVGAGTICGAGLVCNGTACGAGCVIGATFYPAGAVDPANACQVCDPATSTSAWSSGADGTACNDGDACTSGDHCTNGVCGGTPYTCSPTSCQTSVACDGKGGCTGTNAPEGASCPSAMWLYDSYPGICHNGACMYGCLVNGQWYPPQSYYADVEICWSCDPSTSTTSLYTGGCHINNIPGVCSGTGACQLLWGSCTGTGPCSTGIPCTNGICNGYSCDAMPAPDGTSCGPGMVCTGGVCH